MKKNIISIAFSIITLLSFAQDTALKPTKKLAKLNIIVIGNSGENSNGGDIITLVGQKHHKSYSKITDVNGKFSILIPKGEKYKISYKGFDSDVEYSEVEIPNVDAAINFDFTIQYEPPKVYILEGVFFDSGKASLKTVSFKALNELVEVLLAKKSMRIEIAGHTDSDGSEESNMVLSKNRSESVKKYLISKGITANRLVAKGYGENHPMVDNDTPENKQKNRRTVVHIL